MSAGKKNSDLTSRRSQMITLLPCTSMRRRTDRSSSPSRRGECFFLFFVPFDCVLSAIRLCFVGQSVAPLETGFSGPALTPTSRQQPTCMSTSTPPSTEAESCAAICWWLIPVRFFFFTEHTRTHAHTQRESATTVSATSLITHSDIKCDCHDRLARKHSQQLSASRYWHHQHRQLFGTRTLLCPVPLLRCAFRRW